MSFVIEPNKKRRGLALGLAVLFGLLASACSEDAPVSPEDISYEEIEIDAFTLYWGERLSWADSVSGQVMFNFYLDSLGRRVGTGRSELVDEDRLAELPAHIVDSSWGLLFPAKRAPQEFSCSINRNADLQVSESGTPWVEETMAYDGDPEETTVYNRVSAARSIENVFCLYIPGRGFRVESHHAFGTITIRY